MPKVVGDQAARAGNELRLHAAIQGKSVLRDGVLSSHSRRKASPWSGSSSLAQAAATRASAGNSSWSESSWPRWPTTSRVHCRAAKTGDNPSRRTLASQSSLALQVLSISL